PPLKRQGGLRRERVGDLLAENEVRSDVELGAAPALPGEEGPVGVEPEVEVREGAKDGLELRLEADEPARHLAQPGEVDELGGRRGLRRVYRLGALRPGALAGSKHDPLGRDLQVVGEPNEVLV